MGTEKTTPVEVGSNLGLGQLPEARIRLGDGNSTWDKFSREQMRAYAAQEVASERERIRARLLAMDDAVSRRHNYYAHAAVVLFGPNVGFTCRTRSGAKQG